MADFDWKSVVKTVAPALGAAFGGPLGGLATKVIADQLLGDSNATDEQLAQAIHQLKPEDYVKLKDAERQFELRKRELEIEEMKVDAGDRANAREFVKVAKDWEKFGIYIMAYMVIGIFGYGMYWVLSPEDPGKVIPPDRMMLVGAVIGYASAKADQVIAFYFGTSRSSAKKTEQLGDVLSNLTKK